MFWSSVVEAASLLSRLPIWSSPLSSPPSCFLLPSDFCLSRLLTRFCILPWNIFHPSLLSAFFPSAQTFTCQISPFFSSSFFLPRIPPALPNLVSLSVRQDKLSEEVQKWHDGPEENGSPPATQTEPDTGLPPNADPDASQAEEDKDKTKPLLERLKALEVTSSPPHFSFFSLSLLLWLPLLFPFLSTYLRSALFFFIPCLLILLRFHTCSHSWLSFVASLSASCQSPCSVVSESMTAHHILQSSSFGEQSHPKRVAAGASGCTPASVCFPLRSGDFSCTSLWAPSNSQGGGAARVIHADCFLVFFTEATGHILSNLFSN